MNVHLKRLHDWLGEKWYVLPLLSGFFLVLSFHPFNAWPLSFVALVPLLYFVAAYPLRSKSNVFWGGFVTGALFSMALSYFTVVHFNWLPETYVFNTLIRTLSIPISLFGGLLCGLAMVLYRIAYRPDALIQNALVSTSAYVGSEMLIYAVTGGYYFAMLGYAAVDVPGILALAPIGGAFLASFAVAFVNGVLAELGVERFSFSSRWQAITAAAIVGIGMFLLLTIPVQKTETQTVSIATIQEPTREAIEFGAESSGAFFLPSLEASLRQAGGLKPDLLVYPFSPVEGAVYAGQKETLTQGILKGSVDEVGRWVKPLVPASTTIMFWTTLRQEGRFFNNFLFYRDGTLVADYHKRKLFPFMDYTPKWAQSVSLYATPIDMTAGTEPYVPLFGTDVGALLCSEIQLQDLAGGYSGKVPLIVSAGSEAMFADDVASVFSLKAARFRAAEARVPLLRANILGPSAIIEADGSLIAYRGREEGGVLFGEVLIGGTSPTLFSRFGNEPIALLIVGILLCAVARRYHAKND